MTNLLILTYLMLSYPANWIKLGIGIISSIILSLSIHTIMLQNMGVAFPDLSVIDAPYKFIIRIVSVLGLLFFWKLANAKVGGSFAKRWGLLFFIDSMLTEALFRGPFMDGYCTNAICFMFVNNIPKLLTIAVLCGLVVFITPKLTNYFQTFLAATVIAAIFMFAATPLMRAAWSPVMNMIDHLAPTTEWCKLPYGPDVLIPAYISFIEPVLACLTMSILIWDQLSPIKWVKYLLFVLTVLAIKYQLLMPVLYTIFGKNTFETNLASEGQFALEAIALAILAGFTFEWSRKKNLRVTK